MADATATPQVMMNSGLSGILNSLGTLGSTAVSSTQGTQAANAFDNSSNTAITAQGNALNTATQTLAPYTSLGSGATSQLSQLLNGGGTGTPNYSGFNNNPGYQYSVQQGQNAINSQAAASGNLYSQANLANLGSYTAGAASTNYNNYVSQLLQAAGLGGTAAGTSSTQAVTTGEGISNSYTNQGLANASGVNQNLGALSTSLGNGSIIGAGSNLLSSILGGSGTGATSGISSLLGANSQLPGSAGAIANGAGLLNGVLGSGTSQNLGGYNDPNSYAYNTAVDPNYGYTDYNASNNPDLYSSAGMSSNQDLLDSLGFNSASGQAATQPTQATQPTSPTTGDYNPFPTSGTQYQGNGLTGSQDLSASLGALGGLGGVYGSLTSPASAGSILGGLGGANSAANNISQLAGNGNLTGAATGQTLGAAGGLNSIYNAIQNPTVGNVVSGLGGANTAVNDISKLTGNGSVTGSTVGSALGVLGSSVGLYNALQDPSNPANDVAGAYDAYKLYNSGSSLVNSLTGGSNAASTAAGSSAAGAGTSGLLASLGTGAGIGIAGAVLGGLISTEVASDARGPAVTINGSGITQNPYGALPSGNSIATAGNIGIGEGNNEAQGSGQLYQINPTTGQYNWLGQDDTNALINAYDSYSNYGGGVTGAGGASSDPYAFADAYASGNYPQGGSVADASQLATLYGSTGGQTGWGMSSDDFASYINDLFSNVNANGGSGLQLGLG